MWWKEEYERIAAIIAATGVSGLFVGMIKGIVHYRYGGFFQWIALLLGTVFVAIVCGFALHDSSLSQYQQWAVIGVAAYLADDILIALVSIATLFRSDPFGMITKIFNIIKGRP